MGLLTKAITLSDTPATTEKKKSEAWLDLSDLSESSTVNYIPADNTATSAVCDESDFNESRAIGKLVTFIQNTVPDLYTPARIFSLLQDVFLIKKGALLLFDPIAREYNGWAYTGYDTTTKSRLRIPEAVISELFSRSKKTIVIEADNLSQFKNYFSIREFSLPGSLVAYPFFHDTDTLVGLLLISESEIQAVDFEQIFNNLETVLLQISNIIYASREKLLHKSSGGQIKTNDNLLREIENAIVQAESSGSKLFFLTLSVVSILDSLRKETGEIDIFQIQNDIMQIISNMMPEGDNIFLIDYGRLFIILSGRYHINKDLFFHQIKTAVASFFSTIEAIDFQDYSFIEYPADAQSAQEIIQRVFN